MNVFSVILKTPRLQRNGILRHGDGPVDHQTHRRCCWAVALFTLLCLYKLRRTGQRLCTPQPHHRSATPRCLQTRSFMQLCLKLT